MDDLIIRSARWDITNCCNLQCIHCYTDRNFYSDLKLASVKLIIDKLYSLGVREINFSGKEPTLRKDIQDIIKFTSSKNIKANMTTNGTNNDFSIYFSLIDKGLDMLFFSLDGANASIHDEIRGKSTFSKTCKNIERCSDYIASRRLKTRIGISTTILKLNHRSIHKILDICQNLGIHMLAVNPVSLYGSASFRKDQLYVRPNNISKTWERICEKYSNMRSNFNMYLGTFPMEAKLLNIKYSLQLPVIQTGCSAGKTIYINNCGDALPCYMLPPVSHVIPAFKKYVRYWKIIDEPISYATVLFKPFIEYATNYNQKNNIGCHNCTDFLVCKRCPLIAVSDNDAITRCQIAKSKIARQKLEMTSDMRICLKTNFKGEVRKNKLYITLSLNDYKCEKEYELDPLTIGVWKHMMNGLSLEEVLQKIRKMFKSSDTINLDYVKEIVQFFWKENIIDLLE